MIDDVFDILNITGQTTYYLLVLYDNMCKQGSTVFMEMC